MQRRQVRPRRDEHAACGHPVRFGALCGVCGADLSNERAVETVSTLHTTAWLRVTPDEAERLQRQHTHELLAARKLVLVCDLDQTLVHACRDPGVEMWLNEQPAAAETNVFRLLLPGQPTHYVRLRPHLREFLLAAAELFELHIYTQGSRQYADGVAAIIDETGRLFAQRILTRDEVEDISFKSLKRLFPADDSMVLVIDDRTDVWNWSSKLIPVMPYEFFVGAGDINARRSGPAAPAQLVMPKANDDDDALVHLAQALRRIHARFYEAKDSGTDAMADTKVVVPAEKSRALQPCVLAFSGVIPQGMPLASAHIVQLAEDYGAECTDALDDETTHLVVHMRSGRSDKVKRALSMASVCIVTLQWLTASIQRWSRQPEEMYVPDDLIDVNNAERRLRPMLAVDVDYASVEDELDREAKALLAEDDDDDDEDFLQDLANDLEQED